MRVSPQLHVCMVCGFRPTPGGGGTEKHVYELARGLLARGVDVDIICEDRSFLPDPENALHSHLIGIPPQTLHADGWVESYAEKSRRFAAALDPSRYSLVHCHNQYGFNTALKLAQLGNPPVLVSSFHLTPLGVLRRQEQLGLPLPEGAPIDRAVGLMEETAAHLSDHCIAVSRGVAQEVHELYGVPPARISVIYNWYDDDVFYPRDQQQARKDLGLAPDGRYVVYVGHFHNLRGTTLAEALPLIADDVVLIAIHPEAEDDLTGELAAQRHRILCPGYVPPERLALYFAAADVQLFPSVYGGFGLVLVEGMACGCPPVAFDYPAMNEIITDDSGYLVPEVGPEAYATAVTRALADGPAKRSGTMARARDFDMDAQIDKVLALYHQLVAARPQRRREVSAGQPGTHLAWSLGTWRVQPRRRYAVSGSNDEVQGKTEELKGRGQQAWGDLTGNEQDQAEGQAKQTKGNAQQAVGNVKQAVSDLTDNS